MEGKLGRPYPDAREEGPPPAPPLLWRRNRFEENAELHLTVDLRPPPSTLPPASSGGAIAVAAAVTATATVVVQVVGIPATPSPQVSSAAHIVAPVLSVSNARCVEPQPVIEVGTSGWGCCGPPGPSDFEDDCFGPPLGYYPYEGYCEWWEVWDARLLSVPPDLRVLPQTGATAATAIRVSATCNDVRYNDTRSHTCAPSLLCRRRLGRRILPL